MIRLAVLATLLLVACEAQKDCDGSFADCEQGGTCAALMENNGASGKSKCMQEHKYEEECECLCKLFAPPCNKKPEEAPAEEPPNEDPIFPEDSPPPPSDAGAAGGGCFGADAKVNTNRGVMTMEQLVEQKDVLVETISPEGKPVFQDILFWSHVEPDTTTTFLEFTTESGHKLQLTPTHIAYSVPCTGGPRTAKFAEKFTPGECTLVREGDSFVPSKITTINSVEKTGIYSLITPTGSIVVEDVAASCHAAFDNEPIVHFLAMNVYRVLQLLPQGMVNLVYGATDFRAAMASITESL